MEKEIENVEEKEVNDELREEKIPFESRTDGDKKDIRYKSYTLGKRLGIKK